MNTRTAQISGEARDALPQPLADYLLVLAAAGEYAGRRNQTFLLRPGRLGGREIQTLIHYADGEASCESRTLFGFSPVCCVLNWDGAALTLLSAEGAQRCA